MPHRRRARRSDGIVGSAFDRRLIPPMVIGAILNPVNSSIIAVSLVPIGAAFGVPPSQTAWLVSALYLATAVGQPVVGRLVDLFGPRRLYLIGAVLTLAAGVVGTAAPAFGWLIAARVLLGLGTCAGYPSAMTLIRREADRTGHESPAGVLTVLAISTQTISVVGPTIGGLLIGLAGWRATLAVNVPLAIASLALALARLPRDPRPRGLRREVLPVLDLPGMALFAGALTALLVFLMELQSPPWAALAGAVILFAGFAVRERRAAVPFIDLRVLGGNVPLVLTYLRVVLAQTVSYAFLYGFTQWLEDGRGLTATQAGLLLLPVFLVGIVVSTTTGPRPQIRGKLVVGALTQVAGSALLLLLTGTSAIWTIVAVTVVLGIPQGLNNLANQNAVYLQADPERLGGSAGLMRTFMYLGAIIASAANAALFGDRVTTTGLHDLAAFAVAVSLALVVVTVADRSLASTLSRRQPRPQETHA